MQRHNRPLSTKLLALATQRLGSLSLVISLSLSPILVTASCSGLPQWWWVPLWEGAGSLSQFPGGMVSTVQHHLFLSAITNWGHLSECCSSFSPGPWSWRKWNLSSYWLRQRLRSLIGCSILCSCSADPWQGSQWRAESGNRVAVLFGAMSDGDICRVHSTLDDINLCSFFLVLDKFILFTSFPCVAMGFTTRLLLLLQNRLIALLPTVFHVL